MFSKFSDQGWAFLRLTAFAFDNEADQIAAAGSELTKTLANEAQAIKRIGSFSLGSLVEAAV